MDFNKRFDLCKERDSIEIELGKTRQELADLSEDAPVELRSIMKRLIGLYEDYIESLDRDIQLS